MHTYTHIHTYASMSCRTGRSENSSSSESSRASEEDTDCSTQQSGVIPEEQNDPQDESIDRVSKPDDICSLQDPTTTTSSEKTSNTTRSTGLYYGVFINPSKCLGVKLPLQFMLKRLRQLSSWQELDQHIASFNYYKLV